MAKMCEVCGKAPVFGNRVSHAHNVSSRRWMPNLQRVRVMVGSAVQADERLHPLHPHRQDPKAAR